MKVVLNATNPRNKEWDNLFRANTSFQVKKILIPHTPPYETSLPNMSEILYADEKCVIAKYPVYKPRHLQELDKVAVEAIEKLDSDGLFNIANATDFHNRIYDVLKEVMTSTELEFYYQYRSYSFAEDGNSVLLSLRDKNGSNT